jgi:hypothetical protein
MGLGAQPHRQRGHRQGAAQRDDEEREREAEEQGMKKRKNPRYNWSGEIIRDWDLCIEVDGEKIAIRAPDKWVSLNPFYDVIEDNRKITVLKYHDGNLPVPF